MNQACNQVELLPDFNLMNSPVQVNVPDLYLGMLFRIFSVMLC